jgi:peptide/nickel transport system permease protein
MIAYIVRRLIGMLPSLFIVSILVFLFIHFIPGDPAQVMLGDLATPAEVNRLRAEMGLDRPVWVQYWKWLAALSAGNLGTSIFFHQPVLSVIADRTETSLLLALMTLTLIVFVGIPIGFLSATRYGGKLDQTISSLAIAFASIPTFWLGLNLMTLFAVYLKLLPSSGFPSILKGGSPANLVYLVLPSITLAAPNSALIIRLTRASMLDVFKEDYVRTARAKGLAELTVNVAHVFRNSLNAVMSALGFTFAALVSGTVVTETVFSLPGIGRLVVESILRRDYPVMQGIILTIALLYMLVNLAVDLSYGWLDPRIRNTYAGAK